jgi:hypothetical protein
VPISSATKGDGIGLRDEHSVADANSRCIQTDPGADDDIRITILAKRASNLRSRPARTFPSGSADRFTPHTA